MKTKINLIRKNLLSSLSLISLILLSSCASIHDNNNDDKNLADIIKHFKKHIKVEDVGLMRHDVVKASGGVGLKIAGKGIAVYKYNKQIPKQKKKVDWIIEHGFVYILAVEFPAVVNGSFVMIQHNNNPKQNEVIEIFEKF